MKLVHISLFNNPQLDKCLEEIDKKWGIEFIILGGSRGLHLDNEYSDYDITIFLKDFDKIYLYTREFKGKLNLDLSFMNLQYIYNSPRTIYNFKNLTMLMYNFIEEDAILYKNDSWTFEKIKKIFKQMSKTYVEWMYNSFYEYIYDIKYTQENAKLYYHLCSDSYLITDNLDEWKKNKEVIRRIKEFEADFNDLDYMISRLEVWKNSNIEKKKDVIEIIEGIINE